MIKTVLKIVEEQGFEKVTEVKIRVGEMQQLEHEIFKAALLQLKPAKLKDTQFNIEISRTKLRCRVCGYEWLFNKEAIGEDVLEAIHFLPEVSHAYIKCPGCGSSDFEVAAGRGVWIESVRGVGTDG